MQSAQTWAGTQLTYQFPEEYRELYLKEKQALENLPEVPSNCMSRAQGRAKRYLIHKYPDVYRVLYEIAAEKGYPRTNDKRRVVAK